MDQEAMQTPFLVGPRLYLRPLEPEQDSEKVAYWNNEEQMRSYFNVYPTSYTRMRELCWLLGISVLKQRSNQQWGQPYHHPPDREGAEKDSRASSTTHYLERISQVASTVETDMSIPMVTPQHAYELAQDIVRRGITRIKIKVGGDLREDVDRVEAARGGAPQLGITLDANQGYTPNQALLCLEALDDRDIRPLLMEQPVHKDDYEGLRYITQHTTIPIAADESASTAAAVARLLTLGAVNVVNIKLMKAGILEALDIATLCRVNHVGLMIGAMMESRLATSAAAHLAAGLGGFSFIDLDTPMLLAEDPFTGGYEQQGGVYDVSGVKSGLGIERK